jgi:mRNA interferase HigB
VPLISRPVRCQNRSTSQLSTLLIPEWDRPIISYMRVIAKRTLRRFWESAPQYADAKGPLEAWYAEARKAQWYTPQDIKAQFRQASILKNNRVVFNIGGNKYRLIAAMDYQRQALFIRFIGTHAQYNTIDAEVV